MNQQETIDALRQGAEIARDVMLRDQIAMMALQGMLARPKSKPFKLPVDYANPRPVWFEDGGPEHYAEAAYLVADYMLKARAKP